MRIGSLWKFGIIVTAIYASLLHTVYAYGPWNGKACAFSFCTDDAYIDNLAWKEVFDEFNCKFTIFVNTSVIGGPERLTEDDLNYLHQNGFEIGSHTISHPHLLRNTAFKIRYIGNAAYCRLKISEDSLFLDSANDEEDVKLFLSSPENEFLVDLVNSLNSLPFICCTLLFYPHRLGTCMSRYLVVTDWVDIKNQDYTALTEMGCSLEELIYEVKHSKEILESLIVDPSYICKTFAYPYHEHDWREMEVVRDTAGYIAARDGTFWCGKPFGGADGYNTWSRLSLYELPLAAKISDIVGSYNSFTEEETRTKIREFLNEWKQNNTWAVVYTHRLNGEDACDTVHMRWILEELVNDGDVWIAPFGTVAEYVRNTHVTTDGWEWVPVPTGVKEANERGNQPDLNNVVVLVGKNRRICINLGDSSEDNYELKIWAVDGRLTAKFSITSPRTPKGKIFVDFGEIGIKLPSGVYIGEISGREGAYNKFRLMVFE